MGKWILDINGELIVYDYDRETEEEIKELIEFFALPGAEE